MKQSTSRDTNTDQRPDFTSIFIIARASCMRGLACASTLAADEAKQRLQFSLGRSLELMWRKRLELVAATAARSGPLNSDQIKGRSRGVPSP